MTSETVPVDYTYCGSTNFIHSEKIMKIAEMIEEVRKGSRDPVVRKKAFELARDVCSAPLNIKGMGDDNLLVIADAIFMWVRDHIAYVNDPSGEYFQPPVKTLEVGAGDCDDQAILLAAMLGSIGFGPIIVILPEHVYVDLQVGEKQLPMDPTVPKAAFGTLSTSMVEHFKEKYELNVEDYLRVPITDHLIVTAKKQIVATKTPLAMAMYLEKKAAASYDDGDYPAAESRFVKAAKMYHDAGLHAELSNSREGLFVSSSFCTGWAHLMRVMHQILNRQQNDVYSLQSEIEQARSCFKISRSYFEEHDAAEVAGEVAVLDCILDGHQETLLADFLMHIGDRDTSLRHYAKAGEMYGVAMSETKLRGLRNHIGESLASISDYKNVPQITEMTIESVEIPDDDNFSETFDISPEDLKKIQERLTDVTGRQLRKEFLTLSVETGIPTTMLEVIHSHTVEMMLKVDYPHPKGRYANVVQVSPEAMEQLGLQNIDRARIVFGGKEHVVIVKPLDDNLQGVIKINKGVRDVLGVGVGDTVRLKRASVGVVR